MDFKNKLHTLKAAIVSHIYATGPSQELEEFLKAQAHYLIFIGHPFSFAAQAGSFYRVYIDNQIKTNKATKFKLYGIFSYLKDIICTLSWIILCCPYKLDVYFGVDPLNCFCGIILKKIGKARKVVFYAIDYTPRRFNNKLLNIIYHRIDSYCASKSDYVWNLSERMIKARVLKGVTRSDNQQIVPIGVNFNRIKRRSIAQIDRKSLVFMGHVKTRQGLELLIDSLPEIINKVPDSKLIIVGTGELEDYLREKAKKLCLQSCVEFKGYIKDHRALEDVLTGCSIGIALYEPHPDSVTWYADSSKPKQYMACGLPIIITGVSQMAEVVKEKKIGIVVDYSKDDFVPAAVKLLTDDSLYFEYRKNAIEYAGTLHWDKIFYDALQTVLNARG